MCEATPVPQGKCRVAARLCHNEVMAQTHKILVWALLAALAALVSYFGIRSYLSPDLLLNFANTLYC